MVDVMPRQLRRDPVGCERAVLGMREASLALRGRKALEHRDIEAAQRRVSVERRGPVGMRVDRLPRILIHRLGDVALLTRAIADTRRQGHFGLCEVNQDLTRAPFAWRVALLPRPLRPLLRQAMDLPRGFSEGLERIERAEIV